MQKKPPGTKSRRRRRCRTKKQRRKRYRYTGGQTKISLRGCVGVCDAIGVVNWKPLLVLARSSARGVNQIRMGADVMCVWRRFASFSCSLSRLVLLAIPFLTSCGGGGGGDSPTASAVADPLRVTSATLAPNVVTLNSATDGLVTIEPGVFFSKTTTTLVEGAVFLREGAAYKVTYVDASSGGSATVFTEAPSLDEVYSDLIMSGWISSSLLAGASKSISTRQSERAMATTPVSLLSCLTSAPLGGVSDLNGFGFNLGFDKCQLDQDRKSVV